MLSENHFSVLNAIYLKKMVTPATISDMTSLPIEDVIEQIEESEKLEMLLKLPDGVMLLTDGTQQVVGYYMQHYVNLRTQASMLQWYENFESLNSRFIANVTDWQKSDGDERLERKLLQCAERLAKDIGQLVPAIARYAGYVRRFEQAWIWLIKASEITCVNPRSTRYITSGSSFTRTSSQCWVAHAIQPDQ